MRRFILVTALAAISLTPAHAGDIAIKLNDGAQNAILQLPGMMDGCIAGMTLRNDASSCKGVANLLLAMSNEVHAEQAKAAKEAADASAKPADAPAP